GAVGAWWRSGWSAEPRATGGATRVAGDGWRETGGGRSDATVTHAEDRCRPVHESWTGGTSGGGRARVGGGEAVRGGTVSGEGRGGGDRGVGGVPRRSPGGGPDAAPGMGQGGGKQRGGEGRGSAGSGGGEGLGWAGWGRGGSGPTAGSCAGSAVSTAATVSTASGFCSEVTSPSGSGVTPRRRSRSACTSCASSRRMILPERVRGRSGTAITCRGLAIGPTSRATRAR